MRTAFYLSACQAALDKAHVVGQEAACTAVKKVSNFSWVQREYCCQGVTGHHPHRLNLVTVAFACGPKAR